MTSSEDEDLEKHGKKCGDCNRDTLLPYEFDWTFNSCGFNLIKREHQLTKIQ